MAYGLKYQTQFTSQSDDNNAKLDYTLQFLFKDYVGEVATLTGAETTVIQKCTLDDPFAAIKGQSLSISILNKGGSLPITAFQSNEDDDIQVKLLQGTNLLFIGFLVQDDFYEPMVDFTHPIQLSANDGLGLLKGVVLSDASVRRAYEVSYFGIVLLPSIIYVNTPDPAFYPQAGDIFEVAGTSYTVVGAINVVQTISGNPTNWAVEVTPVTPVYALTTGTVYLDGEINLLNKNSLLSIIAICLGQTNLPLITNIYSNIYEYRQDETISTFEQTLINSQVFIKGDSYDDCYTALEKLLKAFHLSLFQANGQWNIIRWFDAPPKVSWSYTNNAIPAFIYDETWAAAGSTILNNNFFIGPDPQLSRPIAGLTQGALRGYKFTKRKFDFKQPDQLLKNYNLQYLGPLLRTYLSGTTQISEYTALFIQGSLNTPYVERFIRVEVDTILDREIDRYLVIRGQGYDDIKTVPFDPVECNAGDRINFSCKFRTNVSGIPGTVNFALQIYDGSTERYLDSIGATVGNLGIMYWSGGYLNCVFPAGEDSIEWHEIDTTAATLPTPPIPDNSLLTVYMSTITDPPQSAAKESHFKDIVLEYIPYINDSTKIIGQTHTQTRPTGPKLFSEQEIVIDDSPRNSVDGTLFLTTQTGVLQDRTLYWRYPATADGWRLGELTTLDELMWRQKTRSKLEGGFIGNYQNGLPVSLLTVGITDFNPTKNYIFGLLTIDYKRNQFSGTLWELYDNTDSAEFERSYEFKYLYSST